MGVSAAYAPGWWARFAFRELRAFPIVGAGGAAHWWRLRLRDGVAPASAPRDADLLVLAGEIPDAWYADILALFETMALPRLLVWLRPDFAARLPAGLPIGATVEPDAEPDLAALRQILLQPDAPGSQALLEDRPSNPWRGQGDHGQGGEGMMGGVPYGRPMAMTAEDADGLALDDVPTYLGPFFSGLPHGLKLELRMQGDRIRQCTRAQTIYPGTSVAHIPAPALGLQDWLVGPLHGEAVAVATIERARARSHLWWMADFCELSGLSALADKGRRLALQCAQDEVDRWIRACERGGLRWLHQGVGVLGSDRVHGLDLRGPVAKAAGADCDSRSADAVYQALDFQPHTETAGDNWARWRVRARECVQSLDLAARAGDRAAVTTEGVRGSWERRGDAWRAPSTTLLHAVPGLVEGEEWSQAVFSLASLDLDAYEAAIQ